LCFPHKTEYKPVTTKMEPIALHSQVQKTIYHVRLQRWKRERLKMMHYIYVFADTNFVLLILMTFTSQFLFDNLFTYKQKLKNILVYQKKYAYEGRQKKGQLYVAVKFARDKIIHLYNVLVIIWY
jgi:hypothetical protein